MQLIDDYFKDYKLVYKTREGQRKVKIMAEAAQRSILSPILWVLPIIVYWGSKCQMRVG